jgi:hypothetical protein
MEISGLFAALALRAASRRPADPDDALIEAMERHFADGDGGHLSRVMSASRDAYRDWVAFHRRREERDARLAPARRRGLAAYEAAHERLASAAPARGWSPMVASVFGEEQPDYGIW